MYLLAPKVPKTLGIGSVKRHSQQAGEKKTFQKRIFYTIFIYRFKCITFVCTFTYSLDKKYVEKIIKCLLGLGQGS